MEATLLKNAFVYRIEKGEYEVMDVYISGGRIYKSFEGKVREIDLKGKYLMPGFFDCHVHLTWSGGNDPKEQVFKEGNYITFLRAYRNSLRSLAYGITNLVDVGSHEDMAIYLSKAIRSGVILGPEIIASGRIITITGGHGFYMGYEVNGSVEALKAVRELIKKGAEIIKIAATSGAYGDTGAEKLESYQLNDDEISTIVKEAHKFFIKVTAHAVNSKGIHNALINGVDIIQHGVFLNEEDAKFMAMKGRSLVPTLYVYQRLSRGGVGVMERAVEKAKIIARNHYNSFRIAIEMGVNIASGTDAGSPTLGDHPTLFEEVITMNEAGLDKRGCLKAMTINAAKALGIESQYGTIDDGKVANLVVLERDPLADLKNLYSVEKVIINGRIYDSKQLLEITSSMSPFFPGL